MLRQKPDNQAYLLAKLGKLAEFYSHWGFRVLSQAQR
jgi:hypothetical protein